MECNLSNFRKEAWKTYVRASTGFEPMPPLDTSWALKPTELQSHTFGDMQILFHLKIEIRITWRKEETTKICLAPNV